MVLASGGRVSAPPSASLGRRKSRPVKKESGPVQLHIASPARSHPEDVAAREASADALHDPVSEASDQAVTVGMSGESADGPLAAETSEVLETTSKYSDASDLEHAHTAQQPEAVNRPVDKAKQRALAEYLERSVRPELTRCSEQEFLDDYKLFHEITRYGSLKFSRVHGEPLDIFNLYRQACDCGGFDKYADGINWTGQVFPAMKNWKDNHKQTGIGNHLRTQYCKLLLQYERVHQDDLNVDACQICKMGDEDFGAQWLLCTTCEGWFHYHCALKEVKQRPKTANAKIYKFSVYENAKRGVEYTCTGCLHGAQVLQAFGGANDAESDENGTDAAPQKQHKSSSKAAAAAGQASLGDTRKRTHGAATPGVARAPSARAPEAPPLKVARTVPGDQQGLHAGAHAARQPKASAAREEQAAHSSAAKKAPAAPLRPGAPRAVPGDAAAPSGAPANPILAPAAPATASTAAAKAAAARATVMQVPTARGIVIKDLPDQLQRDDSGDARPDSDSHPAETPAPAMDARPKPSFEDLLERAQKMTESLKKQIKHSAEYAELNGEGVDIQISRQVLARVKKAKQVTIRLCVNADLKANQLAYKQLHDCALKFGEDVMAARRLQDWYAELCHAAKVKVVSSFFPMLDAWREKTEDAVFAVELDRSAGTAIRVTLSTRGAPLEPTNMPA
eukprot:jgi/Tetstr1/432604/TSEL_021973.t1